MPKPKSIIAIYGPTAVGKSRIAIEVARAVDGEIISADSMQVYKGIPIITDQPTPDELAAVPHHLVGFISLDDEYSAARFAEDASAAIDDISSRGRLPIIVGGTGLYIRALLGGFSFAGIDDEMRRRWEVFVDEYGPEAALLKLEELDPRAAAFIDGENPRRLVRALEAAAAGEPVSSQRDLLWSKESSYDVSSFALETQRELLYEWIECRVDEMLVAGAIEEVRGALEKPISRTAMQAIGLQEIRGYLNQESSLEEAAAVIKQKSRNYARRQLTWMRKMPDVARIDVAGREAKAAAGEIIKQIKATNDTSSA